MFDLEVAFEVAVGLGRSRTTTRGNCTLLGTLFSLLDCMNGGSILNDDGHDARALKQALTPGRLPIHPTAISSTS